MTILSRGARKALLLGALLCLAGATVAVSAQNRVHIDRPLVAALEMRFSRTAVHDWSHVTGLVVAGGSAHRTAEALRLARLHRHLKLVLTGPAADEIAQVLQAEGVAQSRITIEPYAINTYENAVLSKLLAAPQPGERWLLVTSPFHMPRAIGSFYGAGFFVEPWPIEEKIEDRASLAHVARHEWLGLIAYRIQGRTIAVFPSLRDLERMRAGG